MTTELVVILLLGIASVVMAVLAINGRAWPSAAVHLLAGVTLALVAFGQLP